MNKIEIILSYLSNTLQDGDVIRKVGYKEIQYGHSGNVQTNYVFKNNILKDSIKSVVDMYLEEEKKHWEESGKPKNHVYNSLLILNKLI